jgi:hypothetical protein
MHWKIISVWESSHSIQGTANTLHTTRKAVRHAIHALNAAGSIVKRKSAGRPRALSGTTAQQAAAMLLSGEYSSADLVTHKLHSKGLTAKVVHKTTLIRAATSSAKASGNPIHASRGHPRKQLSKANQNARLAFCQINLRRDWKRVMLTDRKKFLFKHPGTQVRQVWWLLKGKRPEAITVNDPMGVNVYVGITPHGATTSHAISGTSKHTSYTNKAGVSSKNITDARGCHTFSSFKNAVMDECRAVPKNMLRNLYASMPTRPQKVIDLNGGKIDS